MANYQESIYMDYVKSTTSADKVSPFYSKLAKISLFIYLFFVFFGTSAPFRERITDVEDITTSNPVNQIVFSFLYILSFISILPKRHSILQFLKTEKFLTFFLLWALFTVIWSDFPIVSLKLWIQMTGTVIILLSALLHLRSADEALPYFKAILILYIPLTFLSILLIPGATDWRFPAWRGLAPHKNMLGQVSLFSLIIWSFALRNRNMIKKIVVLLFLVLSFILLIGSKSTTSWLAAGLLVCLAGLWHTETVILRPTVGRFLAFTVFFSSLLILLLTFLLASDLVASALHFFQKDVTLTGRVHLWSVVFKETKKHLLFGCGLGGFWVPNSPAMDAIYQEFVWLPNQSHLGYLDILNETGILGISLFGFMVFFYFRTLGTVKKPHPWKWLVIAVLIVNVSESTLFGGNTLQEVLFIFSYLALYADLRREASTSSARMPPSVK